MAANYLHGSETVDVEIGGQTVKIVKTAVIALFGIAPTESKQNQLYLTSNSSQDATYGKPVPGFNIPKTLEIIRGIVGNNPVLVVNVFDATDHTTAVTLETHTIADGKTKLAFAPFGTMVIKESDGTTTADIELDVDYSIDEYGNFTVLSSAIEDGRVLKFSYRKLNAAAVTSSVLIGAIDTDTNARTGCKLFDLAFNTYGFTPKIIISPTYASLTAIATEMASMAAKFKAEYYLDDAYGTTIAEALVSRGVASTSVFKTADKRASLLFPWIKTYDKATDADADYPYSAFKAGIRAKVDRELGYWYSDSNKEILNATGVETPIQWSINDAASEANALNEIGIITVAQGFGTGIRTWGNRNASFPSSSSAKNFACIQRVDDIISESMELAALPFIDLPITQPLIDTIREEGNELMRVLIQRGALLPGSEVLYHPEDNEAGELAAGHITFERKYMGPTPAERITYKSVLDITLLNQFK
jgi:uncharacterized protein